MGARDPAAIAGGGCPAVGTGAGDMASVVVFAALIGLVDKVGT